MTYIILALAFVAGYLAGRFRITRHRPGIVLDNARRYDLAKQGEL